MVIFSFPSRQPFPVLRGEKYSQTRACVIVLVIFCLACAAKTSTPLLKQHGTKKNKEGIQKLLYLDLRHVFLRGYFNMYITL